MDIAENGISAGASLIRILVNEDRQNNLLTVEIEDNGRGMPAEMLAQVTDPFITSRTTRRVGLGLSLLQAAAQRCDGEFKLESELGKGTRTFASFRYDHIDRAPVGDTAGSLTVLMMGNPNIDFNYTHQVDKKRFHAGYRRNQKRYGRLFPDRSGGDGASDANHTQRSFRTQNQY